MFKITAALALMLAFGSATAQTQTYKHENGRDCVDNSEVTVEAGYIRVWFENICSRSFSIKIKPAGDSVTRGSGIGPGTPTSPARSSIVCKPADRCEDGEWWVD